MKLIRLLKRNDIAGSVFASASVAIAITAAVLTSPLITIGAGMSAVLATSMVLKHKH